MSLFKIILKERFKNYLSNVQANQTDQAANTTKRLIKLENEFHQISNLMNEKNNEIEKLKKELELTKRIEIQSKKQIKILEQKIYQKNYILAQD